MADIMPINRRTRNNKPRRDFTAYLIAELPQHLLERDLYFCSDSTAGSSTSQLTMNTELSPTSPITIEEFSKQFCG